ncbi:hypothetical protein MACK_002209 [Theileria orientalis]|uniref:Uncharacterized protein n=1 Tax=Theileria orientalis TaxID=68886 RepID=A0A976MB87_THEOR|nr:hypothetical protein MACK_002209 [Theileria orientalis]
MKILNSLLLFILGTVTADRLADTRRRGESLYLPLEGENGLVGDNDDYPLVEQDYELGEYPEDPEEVDYLTEIYDEPKPEKRSRRKCPYGKKGCKFKKAKCVCTSKDATYKFIIKKFKTVGDKTRIEELPDEPEEPRYLEQAPEWPRYIEQLPMEPNYIEQPPMEPYGPPDYPAEIDQPMGQYYDSQTGTEDIMNKIPSVMEDFKSVETMVDPKDMIVDVPSSQGGHQLPLATGVNGFDDKTVRVKTEDNNDQKVREYEYLRIKNIDDKGVEEKHIETPLDSRPEVSYHKGVVPEIDHSVKNSFFASLSAAQNNNAYPTGFPVGTRTVGTQTEPQLVHPQVLTPAEKVQMKLEELKRSNEQLLATPPSVTPIPLTYPNVTDDELDRQKLEEKLRKKMESTDRIQRKLEEVRRRNDQLLREGASRQPITTAYYNTSNPSLPPAATPADRVQMKLNEVRRRNEQLLATPASAMPIPLAYTNVPIESTGGALVNQSTGVTTEGASLRGLKKRRKRSKKGKKSKKAKKTKKSKKNKKNKKSKARKNEEKMRKKMEKKRRREEKKKAKMAKKEAEKRERERLDEMKERERLIEEKLDEEKEELEESQLAASERARVAKRLQQQQDLQQRRIDQTERNMQIRRQRQRQLEEKRRIQRLRREKMLMKRQERDLGDLSTSGSDEEDEIPISPLFQDGDDDDDDDE